ncbi:alpha/beta hydrolase [Roseibium sp.]|uniref:alpha/beta hydrolase n=1 Tax=Roseibium sp. TaxID=1936156 RepID=UPI003A975235
MKRYLTPLAALAILATTHVASAQVVETPDIAKNLHDLGNQLTRETVGATMKIYGPLHAQTKTGGIEKVADQTYGPAERNVLDVYRPEDANGSQPIMIFAHGGGFVRGDKAGAANIGTYFAKHGVVTIVINYRFAPDSQWPSGPEDVANVMSWVRDNAAIHGGDPANVVLAGNSAGSAHVAAYALYESYQIENDGLIGLILISPPTANLTDHEIDPQRDALYYGTDKSTFAERSYINKLYGRTVPIMVAVSQYDIPLVQSQAGQLVQALFERDGHLPVLSTAVGHNHISIVEHIGTGDETLGPDMLEFIKYQSLGMGK